MTLYAQVGSTNETQTTGGNQLPPSGDIATSQQWMVQVNNDVIVMYNWFTNAFVSKNLATFFQYAAFTFDPRVIYDPYWDRFVVLAANCRYCNTVNNLPFLDMAVVSPAREEHLLQRPAIRAANGSHSSPISLFSPAISMIFRNSGWI